jgi:hypothetical protein
VYARASEPCSSRMTRSPDSKVAGTLRGKCETLTAGAQVRFDVPYGHSDAHLVDETAAWLHEHDELAVGVAQRTARRLSSTGHPGRRTHAARHTDTPDRRSTPTDRWTTRTFLART